MDKYKLCILGSLIAFATISCGITYFYTGKLNHNLPNIREDESVLNMQNEPLPNLQDPTLPCWEKHFLDPPIDYKSFKANFIPSTVEEAPIGFAPTIPVEFLIEEKDYCSKRPSLRVIAYVHTAINITDKREVTRKTWASTTDEVGVVYMVGKAKNPEELEIVQRESEMYHDIVQGNYTDLYKLLVYKALNSIHWLAKNCGQVPWVIHADDDVIIDIFKLLPTLQEYDKNRRYNEVFCHQQRYLTPMRNSNKKWVVSFEEYPCKKYPPYCTGPAWFTSMNVIKTMLKTVPLVKYLWVDDIFLPGFLISRGRITITVVKTGKGNVNKSRIGKVLMWHEVNSNRTADWLNILSHYKKT